MEVWLTPHFRRRFRKLPRRLKEEAFESIQQFKSVENHAALRVHKLKGSLEDRRSFSVNYRYRIVFRWNRKKGVAVLLTVGDPSLYD